MADKKQIFFGALATLVVSAGFYLVYTQIVNANFTQLKKRTGKKVNPDGSITTIAGGGRYMFAFFNNNRFSVFSSDGMKLFIKGNYAAGGTILTTDSGATYENPSVFTNQNLLVESELKGQLPLT